MPMHQTVSEGRLDDVQLWSKFKQMPFTATLAATLTAHAALPPVWLLNPGASGRNVDMPLATAANMKGTCFWIHHTGATLDTDLTVRDSTGVTTFGTIAKGQSAMLHCDGATWRFYSMSDSSLWNLDGGTASATAGAATLNKSSGIITSEALTTAQNALYTLTLTNSVIVATDIVFTTLANGTNTQGTPVVVRVTPGSGSVVIIVKNMHDAAQALNGTIKIGFVVLKA